MSGDPEAPRPVGPSLPRIVDADARADLDRYRTARVRRSEPQLVAAREVVAAEGTGDVERLAQTCRPRGEACVRIGRTPTSRAHDVGADARLDGADEHGTRDDIAGGGGLPHP